MFQFIVEEVRCVSGVVSEPYLELSSSEMLQFHIQFPLTPNYFYHRYQYWSEHQRARI